MKLINKDGCIMVKAELLEEIDKLCKGRIRKHRISYSSTFALMHHNNRIVIFWLSKEDRIVMEEMITTIDTWTTHPLRELYNILTNANSLCYVIDII